MVMHIRTREEITQLMIEVREENCQLRLAPQYQVWATRLADQLEHKPKHSMFSTKLLKTYTKREATRYKTAVAKCVALSCSV